jgi:hypothetical protein
MAKSFDMSMVLYKIMIMALLRERIRHCLTNRVREYCSSLTRFTLVGPGGILAFPSFDMSMVLYEIIMMAVLGEHTRHCLTSRVSLRVVILTQQDLYNFYTTHSHEVRPMDWSHSHGSHFM